MDVETVFRNLVNAGMLAKTMDETIQKAGYDENPYFDIYGSIFDAIYSMIGEHTEAFEASFTYLVFNSEITNERRVNLLLSKYEENAQSSQ